MRELCVEEVGRGEKMNRSDDERRRQRVLN